RSSQGHGWHTLLRQAFTLVSLVLLGLWVYRFEKIGVAFMPALDEGTLLEMPVTVPRASVTQAADDLKARDALLRGFPEVESVVGKAGRADTPTDPAPLDMVETFVNFRPAELWPKRVLKFDDAQRHVRETLTQLVRAGFVKADFDADGPREQAMLDDVSQKALERYDETIRELALLRYQEVEHDLGPHLTRFAVAETVRQIGRSGRLAWPDRSPAEQQAKQAIDNLASELAGEFGPWLARNPAWEDLAEISRRVAVGLQERGAIDDAVAALEMETGQTRGPNRTRGLAGFVVRLAREAYDALRDEPQTFAGILLVEVNGERAKYWRARVQRIDWEFFDTGTEVFAEYALEESAKAAVNLRLADDARAPDTQSFAAAAVARQLDRPCDVGAGEPFVALRDGLTATLRNRVFLRPRRTGPKGDLVDDEMGRVLQVPGWSNIFTQPIIARIEMLSTGVRTDIGVKVFGPDLEIIELVCKDIEAALKPLKGARDVLAAPIMGKGYLQIDIDRKQAARYGISIEDIQNEIEVALGGRAVTFTVEKRNRFPVRIRYARAQREDEESIRRLLVSPGGAAARAMVAAGGGPETAMAGEGSWPVAAARPAEIHTAAPAHAVKGRALVPLSAVADVRVLEGPAVIKSENGRLLNYVTLNVRGRDIVGFVDEAQRVVAQKVRQPEGVNIAWSGEFEHQVRAARTLRFVFPAVIVLIFVILYLTYNDLADAALMMLAVPEALAGGAFFMYLLPKIVQGWS
ncbi:MAG TPA: efflux RND transporter permease subunit, partial [Pirellulales bacterium]|nr:efflux RND transporter permease subunit [Pirellulales bacterium]